MKQAGAVSYLVNGLGQRVKKTVGAAETYFAYDEAGRLLGEYDGNGAVIQETVWLGDIPVAVMKPKQPSGYDVFYVWADHLNTPRIVSDAANNIRWEWAYEEPFGASLPNEDPSGLGAFTYNLRFPGQYYDAETGMHYNYFRDYDPRIGRYVQSDPIGLLGGSNVYSYVGGSPLSYSDPLGLFELPSIPQPALDFLTGVADAASLGLGPVARSALDVSGKVDACSESYASGQYASLVLGVGRLAYAGAAKALPQLITQGARAGGFRCSEYPQTSCSARYLPELPDLHCGRGPCQVRRRSSGDHSCGDKDESSCGCSGS